MLPCTSTEMDGVLMTASTLMVEEFDQDPKIRWWEPKALEHAYLPVVQIESYNKSTSTKHSRHH